MLWRRGKSYSQDLRDRVFAGADDDEPVGRIAVMLRVSVSYVSKVLTRRRVTGQTQARKRQNVQITDATRPEISAFCDVFVGMEPGFILMIVSAT
jgi:hypothetical protein